jgi:Toxin SymE, type I toxin-antitoxin system
MADVESTQNAPANIELIAPEIPIPPSGSEPVRYLTIGRGDPGPRVLKKSDCGVVRPVPLLRIQGQWLERAGFEIGKRVNVQVESGRLVIEAEGLGCGSSGLRVHEPQPGRICRRAESNIYSESTE